MPEVKPKDGFDWGHVAWGRPDSPPSVLCSYCSAGIAETEVPLMLMSSGGYVARFCDACQEEWWGVKHVEKGDQNGQDNNRGEN